MRVAVDATSLLGVQTGVGHVVTEMVRGLADRDEIDLTVFATSWRGRGNLASVSPARSRVVTRPMAARPLRQAWRRSDQPVIEHWTGPIDVVHGPNFVVPPARAAAEIVTVHDLTCIRFPELCTPDTLEYPALIRRAIRRGAWVHTVSEAVAVEVRSHFEVDPDRVVAIPNGVRPAEAGAPDVGVTLAGGPRYVLGLGTIEPRKDLPTLVRAFDLVADDDAELRLVVAGPDGWGVTAFDGAVHASRHRERIVRLGWVGDTERTALLRGAAVLAYPSLYEGFGLPPLEAMQVGTPVITSDAAALLETVGDAALTVAVGDHAALAAAIATVTTDQGLATAMADRGHRNVERFSWPRTIDGIVDLYHRAAGA